ncbi:FAD-dependent oxidoreductase [bacterium]|nr:FAD-dependent oxidoreductase [bacterium]
MEIKPECNLSCPLKIDVEEFIGEIASGDYSNALKIIREKNPFPGITGRICPADCENVCVRTKFDEPVAIRQLERFCADYEIEHFGFPQWDLDKSPSKNKSVAIIGAGIAGLACSYSLLRKGYDVDIYDKLSKPGGMLAAAVPQYKLPREILFGEIQIIEKLDGKILLNRAIGEDIELTELRQKYDALFIAIGAGKTDELHIPGKNFDGVFTALDFLMKFNLGNLNTHISGSTKALVFGGNHKAITSARILRRLGAEVHLFLPDEMNELKNLEIQMAHEENIVVKSSIIPTAIFGENRKISAVRCVKIEKSNDNCKIKIIPIENSEFEEDGDIAVFSTIQKPDIESLGAQKYFDISSKNTFVIDTKTSQTNIYGVFAGGVCVNEHFDSISSMADGEKAAISIDKFLTGNENFQGEQSENEISQGIDENEIKKDDIAQIQRNRVKILEPCERENNFHEIEIDFTEQQAENEAKRCIYKIFRSKK